jgi:hypothetical protein
MGHPGVLNTRGLGENSENWDRKNLTFVEDSLSPRLDESRLKCHKSQHVKGEDDASDSVLAESRRLGKLQVGLGGRRRRAHECHAQHPSHTLYYDPFVSCANSRRLTSPVLYICITSDITLRYTETFFASTTV